MSKILFPNNQYWHFSVPNADELNDYIDSIDVDVDKPPNWVNLCDLHTFDYTDNIEGSREKFTELLNPSLKVFTSLVEKPNTSLQFYLDQCWINIYNEGHFQEPHEHEQVDLVAVYFLDDYQEEYGNFYFFDIHKPQIARYRAWKDIFSYTSDWFPHVKRGDIIFFPAYTYHGCTKHKSSTPRRSVAFNFMMRVVK
tara:strand:+ start:1247 stop:1834 length:588 start_codon:yes stop_codon:yes gene_type:complete